MIKKASILTLVLCLLLVFLSPSLVQAQSGLTILDSSVEAEFPYKLNFNLSAESDVDITDIRLSYRVNRVDFAQITSEVYIGFAPATTVNVSWAWDMRKSGGLPPGSQIDYWWTIKDTRGNRVETAPVQIQFNDDRYPWRSLTEGKITIHWYEGNNSFVQEIMATSQQALARLAKDTGAELKKPVQLYIYANTQDLVGALIYPQEWTGGVAFTRFSTIAIGISPSNLTWGKRAIAHELSHMVIHQVTLNPYSGLPVWLDEGLAVYAEGLPNPEYISRLSKAVAEDNLISVRSLSSPFSAHVEKAILSYAESYSIVEFLIHQYGQAKMLELLNTFSHGSSYDGALEKVYGFDMDGLNNLWQDYIARIPQSTESQEAYPALAQKPVTDLFTTLGLATECWAWGWGW